MDSNDWIGPASRVVVRDLADDSGFDDAGEIQIGSDPGARSIRRCDDPDSWVQAAVTQATAGRVVVVVVVLKSAAPARPCSDRRNERREV